MWLLPPPFSAPAQNCTHALNPCNVLSHVFVGPMNPGAALIVQSFGTNISANVRDGALSHKIDHLTYLTDTV